MEGGQVKTRTKCRTGKTPFTSQKFAMRRLNKMAKTNREYDDNERLHVYKCYCGKWHIGHKY